MSLFRNRLAKGMLSLQGGKVRDEECVFYPEDGGGSRFL
jgi:hypothetical protein